MCTKNEAFEILASVYDSCNQLSGGKIHDAILYGSYARGEQTAESMTRFCTALTPAAIFTRSRILTFS